MKHTFPRSFFVCSKIISELEGKGLESFWPFIACRIQSPAFQLSYWCFIFWPRQAIDYTTWYLSCDLITGTFLFVLHSKSTHKTVPLKIQGLNSPHFPWLADVANCPLARVATLILKFPDNILLHSPHAHIIITLLHDSLPIIFSPPASRDKNGEILISPRQCPHSCF